MANEITSSVTSSDQEKFLAASLIKRAQLKLVAAGLCEKVKQKKGAGLTAYFVRYDRMNLPLESLSEGVSPSGPSLTTSHPLFQQAQELLSDNAARVIDREIQLVWLAGTNVQYFDGTGTGRDDIAAGDKMNDATLLKASVTMQDAGALPKAGPDHKQSQAESMTGGQAYVLVVSPAVRADILSVANSTSSFVNAAQYSAINKLYNGEVGMWLGFRIVVTNFIPKFSRLATPSKASSAAAGSLTNATTYYFKVTRKDKARGFEEACTVEFTQATGASDEAIAITLPAGSSYVYNVYAGDTTGDANLFLFAENQAASAVVTVTSIPESGATAPVAPAADVFVHPCYVFAEGACKWVGLQDLQVKMSKAGEATESDPLGQRRTIGYKFLAKALVADQTKLLRIEVSSAY
jgi:hypothetical protein